MSCCGGLNNSAILPAPASDGDGGIINTSGLTAQKAIYLSGDFSGRYTILGSHDNLRFVPLFTFTGTGPQSVKQDIDATLLSMRVRRQAVGAVLPVITIVAQNVCPCAPPRAPD
jgi:hypothetical protein